MLAPIGALLVQASALRLRPDLALASGATTADVFVVASLLAVPALGAAGGTAAGARLTSVSFVGAGLVLVIAVVS